MENSNYKVNDIVKGIVVSIKNYGVFLSFDKAYIGLLHISEISSNFVNDINKYFHVGDVVVNAIVENHAVLQNFHHRAALVARCGNHTFLRYFHLHVNATGKECAPCAKHQLGRYERVFCGAVWR